MERTTNNEFDTDERAPDPAPQMQSADAGLIADQAEGLASGGGAAASIIHDPRDIAEAIKPTLIKLGIDPREADAGVRSTNPFVVAIFLGAQYGRRSFPVTQHEKKSRVLDWPHVASSDPLTLLRWETRFRTPIGKPDRMVLGSRVWKHFRSSNYAGLTGREGGVVVLDIDGEPGRARLAELEKKFGPLPQTETVVSGRPDGGKHLYFAPPPDGPDLKTVAHAFIDGKRDKIDQKGRGGYSILPGSLHSSGISYRYLDGCAPGECALASWPPEWLAILDYADEPAPPREPSAKRSSGQRFHVEHDPSSLLIGDGDGFGGFQNPIYKNAIQYFFGADVDAPAEPIIGALREMIADAPKIPGRDVARYMTGPDLPRIVERAREFVNSVKDSDGDEY